MCHDGAVVRTGGLFSVYQKKQQRPPAGLCIDRGWHRAPAPTGRAARAVAGRGGRKEQRGGHGPPGDWCRRQGDGKGDGKLGELILSIPS